MSSLAKLLKEAFFDLIGYYLSHSEFGVLNEIYDPVHINEFDMNAAVARGRLSSIWCESRRGQKQPPIRSAQHDALKFTNFRRSDAFFMAFTLK